LVADWGRATGNNSYVKIGKIMASSQTYVKSKFIGNRVIRFQIIILFMTAIKVQ